MREHGDDRLLDQPTRTRFDDEEWRRRQETSTAERCSSVVGHALRVLREMFAP